MSKYCVDVHWDVAKVFYDIVDGRIHLQLAHAVAYIGGRMGSLQNHRQSQEE